MSASINRLRVGNEDFLVAAMIERCPRSMMVRELLKNALDAAAGAEEGARRVEFSVLRVEGVPKLALWNTGRGLNGPELRRMCNIATSIRKEAGLDQNFGMGAKVASLPSNQLGMRYRSAREGVVREVVIGKVDGVYGRLLRPGPEGEPSEVLEVTASAVAEGRDPGQDWVEVVLFGNAPGQDTVADPYGGEPRSAPRWLPEAIRRRFLRLPEGIDILFQPGIAGLAQPRRATVVADQLATLEQKEAVRGPDGIVLHYAFDPALARRETGGPWDRRESLAAIVQRDEFYAIQGGAAWLREAPAFGIPFLARAVTILVELPDDYPVLPEAYREHLRYRAGRQGHVVLQDFAAMVIRHQPAWLSRLLAASVPVPDYLSTVSADMPAMMQRMGVPLFRKERKPELERAPRPPAPEPASAASRDKPAAPADPPPLRVETPPAILLLRDPADIKDRGLTHRAATYYPATHQLHVNLAYDAVPRTVLSLLSTSPEELDVEGVQAAAQLVAEQSMVTRIVRTLAHAFDKRARPREWRDPQVQAVLSPEALTLAADHLETGWSEIEAAFAKALTTVPKAAPDAG